MATIDRTRMPRGGPALALVMRGGFALLAQTLVALSFRLRRHPTPWRAAAAWWMVHSSLVDLGCLAVLRWLLGREGLHLHDLLGGEQRGCEQDVKNGLLAIGAQGLAGAASSLLTWPLYPTGVPPLSPLCVFRGGRAPMGCWSGQSSESRPRNWSTWATPSRAWKRRWARHAGWLPWWWYVGDRCSIPSCRRCRTGGTSPTAH